MAQKRKLDWKNTKNPSWRLSNVTFWPKHATSAYRKSLIWIFLATRLLYIRKTWDYIKVSIRLGQIMSINLFAQTIRNKRKKYRNQEKLDNTRKLSFLLWLFDRYYQSYSSARNKALCFYLILKFSLYFLL